LAAAILNLRRDILMQRTKKIEETRAESTEIEIKRQYMEKYDDKISEEGYVVDINEKRQR
jgi:hypothetical protein